MEHMLLHWKHLRNSLRTGHRKSLIFTTSATSGTAKGEQRTSPTKCSKGGQSQKTQKDPLLNSELMDWALFVNSWNRYKEMCGLTNPAKICKEIRIACFTEVNRLLFSLMGAETLNTTTQQQLLCQIRLAAIKGLHNEVHSTIWNKGGKVSHLLARLQLHTKF